MGMEQARRGRGERRSRGQGMSGGSRHQRSRLSGPGRGGSCWGASAGMAAAPPARRRPHLLPWQQRGGRDRPQGVGGACRQGGLDRPQGQCQTWRMLPGWGGHWVVAGGSAVQGLAQGPAVKGPPEESAALGGMMTRSTCRRCSATKSSSSSSSSIDNGGSRRRSSSSSRSSGSRPWSGSRAISSRASSAALQHHQRRQPMSMGAMCPRAWHMRLRRCTQPRQHGMRAMLTWRRPGRDCWPHPRPPGSGMDNSRSRSSSSSQGVAPLRSGSRRQTALRTAPGPRKAAAAAVVEVGHARAVGRPASGPSRLPAATQGPPALPEVPQAPPPGGSSSSCSRQRLGGKARWALAGGRPAASEAQLLQAALCPPPHSRGLSTMWRGFGAPALLAHRLLECHLPLWLPRRGLRAAPLRLGPRQAQQGLPRGAGLRLLSRRRAAEEGSRGSSWRGQVAPVAARWRGRTWSAEQHRMSCSRGLAGCPQAQQSNGGGGRRCSRRSSSCREDACRTRLRRLAALVARPQHYTCPGRRCGRAARCCPRPGSS